MDTNTKELKRKIRARNIAEATRLLSALWPGYTNMPSLRKYVNQLASDLNFSEKWFIEKIDQRVGKHVRKGGVYQPENKKLVARRKEIHSERSRRDHLDTLLLKEELKERKQNIDAGIPYPDMNPEEQQRLKLALQKKIPARETEETSFRFNNVQDRRLRKQPASSPAQSATDTRLWLAGLPEKDRRDFASWCARKGIPVIRKNWEGFVHTSMIDPALTSAQYSQVASYNGQNAISAGDESAGNGSKKDDIAYHERKKIQEPETPLFSRRVAPVIQTFTRAKVRAAQRAFREDVLRNWGRKCAITGTELALEAAHILSHAEGGAPSVENGICLAADLHTLLDSGHLRIVNGKVQLSDKARRDERYGSLEGRSLRKPLTVVACMFEED